MPASTRARLVLVPLLGLSVGLAACSGGARSGGYGAPCAAVPRAAPLVGGEVDDNVRLPEYLDYVAAYPHGDVPKLDLTDRRVMTVVGDDGRPLWDVAVSLVDPSGATYRARTNAAGEFLFPPAALGISPHAPLTAWVEGAPPVGLRPGDDVVRAPGVRPRTPAGVALDMALVVDTTGSMADEVDRLRSTLRSVVARVAAHPARPDVRIGVVAYRDVGDAYVTRPFDFTRDVGSVQRTLDAMRAQGGGDGPEAVQEALGDAVHRLSWRGAGTLRVLFLVGDAPPHFERGTPYTVTMRDAVERGITVVPVACSGMDDTGEFVWRQLAAVTLGTFLFVSYGGSTDHHVGPYPENDLDALMVAAVSRALDALHAPPAFAPARAPSPNGPSAYAPAPAPYVPTPTPRVGWGRAPWDFGVPGWSR
jgi:hypothetical protein